MTDPEVFRSIWRDVMEREARNGLMRELRNGGEDGREGLQLSHYLQQQLFIGSSKCVLGMIPTIVQN